MSPRLQVHQLVPPFALPAGQGKVLKLWDYKMRKNLVILFHQGSSCLPCREKLTEVAENYGEFVKLETEILAVSSEGEENNEKLRGELNLPFPLLSYPAGRVIEKYTYWQGDNRTPSPSVFVTNRFGTLFFQQIAEEITGLLQGEEILKWLLFIQSQCPECSI